MDRAEYNHRYFGGINSFGPNNGVIQDGYFDYSNHVRAQTTQPENSTPSPLQEILGNYPKYNYDPVYSGSNVHYSQLDHAENINARLIRAEYEDYRNRFLPIEKELMRLALDPELQKQKVQNSENEVRRGFNSARSQSSLNSSRLGLKDPSLQTGFSRNVDMSEAAAVANAKNKTRTANKDFTMSIMTGSNNNSKNTRLGGD